MGNGLVFAETALKSRFGTFILRDPATELFFTPSATVCNNGLLTLLATVATAEGCCICTYTHNTHIRHLFKQPNFYG